MDELTNEMMEYICDELCRHPRVHSDEELEFICDNECKMGKLVIDILKQSMVSP